MDTKIKKFKQLYVKAYHLTEEIRSVVDKGEAVVHENVDAFVATIDELLDMLPIEFTDEMEMHRGKKVLLINETDAEDEPREIIIKGNGSTQYKVGPHVKIFFADTVHIVLHDWKFRIWNYIVSISKHASEKERYLPLMLDQALKCAAFFDDVDLRYIQQWQREMLIMYANQIGWYKAMNETDPAELEKLMQLVDRGYWISDFGQFRYIKDTKVRILLKMGKEEEAWAIVHEAFRRDANYEDFLDLKENSSYLQWIKDEKEKEKAAKKKAKEDYAVFQEKVKAEQLEVRDQFINPGHPLVEKYADALNRIKENMVNYRLHRQYSAKTNWQEANHDRDQKFVLTPLAPDQLDERYPEQLKAYLLEIGEGGDGYFAWRGIHVTNDEDIEENLEQSFPLTPDKLHPIKHLWGIDAWVYPDDTDWIAEKVFKKNTDMQAMFGLPEDVSYNNGAWCFGDSNGQDPLYLILNGPFKEEVWVDTLQYGAEASGCFAQASKQKLKFLDFIAASINANHGRYEDQDGAWL